MSTLDFRYADSADAPAIVSLIERAYRAPETAGAWDSESHLLTGPRTSHDEITRLIADPYSRFILAVSDGVIQGCCLVQRRPDTECMSVEDPSASPGAYFGMFAIDPGTRAAGLGKSVLAQAERSVRELWDSPEMVMTVINVREALIAWYERRGYQLTGRRLPFPFSETSGETTRDFDLVEMRKALKD